MSPEMFYSMLDQLQSASEKQLMVLENVVRGMLQDIDAKKKVGTQSAMCVECEGSAEHGN